MGFVATGCLSNGPSAGGSGSGASSSTGRGLGSTGIPGTTSDEPQCVIFKNNARDYQACLGCKTSLCPCTQFDPNRRNSCLFTDLTKCTVDSNQLVQCVHDNLASAGGPCVGLKCSDGQVADFNACLCRDALPPASIGPAPGFEDTTTPFVQPGFFVSDRFCAPADVNTANGIAAGDCLLGGQTKTTIPGGGLGGYTTSGAGENDDILVGNPGKAPVYANQAPANIYSDVGYLRWDLALDASTYGPAVPIGERKPFMGTWATFPITLSMSFRLKPDTSLVSNASVNWSDCVENFSGFTTGSQLSYSSDAHCLPFSTPYPVPLASNDGFQTGVATLANVSANGTAANYNILKYNKPGNPPMANVGLDKADTGATDGTTTASTSTALFSNIGYYKYTWGPLRVKRPVNPLLPPSPYDVASATVSGRIAVNMNLGYTPGSAVESSALSPEALSNAVPSRDCSVNSTPHSCVTTAVYRTPGGGVLSQSFAPRFSDNHDAAQIMALPTGIAAVSTPKVVEDTTQLDVTAANVHRPGRLRTFARAADGNIYMSLYTDNKWHPWLSLGRPWYCSGSCSDYYKNQNGIPALYKPLDLTDPKYGFTTLQNDGLSIVGEPIVVSYMDVNNVYANIGGLVSGAPLSIQDMLLNADQALPHPEGAQNIVIGAHTLRIEFSSGDPTQIAGLAIGQQVFLDGFVSGTGGSLNSSAGAQAMTITDCQKAAGAIAAFIEIDFNTGSKGTISAATGSGITNTAQITRRRPDTSNFGVIGVFVRVSQVRSSDGLTGPLHNTVWYTFSKYDQTGAGAFQPGQALYFDNPANWTSWQMVYDSTTGNMTSAGGGGAYNGVPNKFIVQGNPAVMIDANVPLDPNIVPHVGFYVVATSAYPGTFGPGNGGSPPSPIAGSWPPASPMLHPPVAPEGAISNGGAGSTYTTNGVGGENWSNLHTTTNWNITPYPLLLSSVLVNDNWNIHPNWFNYGNVVARTGLEVGDQSTTSWPLGFKGGSSWSGSRGGSDQHPPALGMLWDTVSFDLGSYRGFGGIASDWTSVRLSDGNYRLFASEITGHENPCFDVEIIDPPTDATGQASYDPPPFKPMATSPCKYDRDTVWIEYSLQGATPPVAANQMTPFFRCQGMYPAIKFMGTPHAVNIDQGIAARPTGLPAPNVGSIGNWPPSDSVDSLNNIVVGGGGVTSAKRLMLFGRAICPDRGRCDIVNPVASYAVVDQNSHCGGVTPTTPDYTPYWDPAKLGAGHGVVDHRIYYPGEALSVTGGGTPQAFNRLKIVQTNVTADVVPIFSWGQHFSGNDAGIYFFTRDANGLFSHGEWEEYTDPSGSRTGAPTFSLFSLGAYTN